MGRGRPKKEKLERDYGTPELRLKRLSISADDPTLSTRPMDVLLARRLISEDEHAAGARFLAYRIAIYGKPHVKSREFDRIRGPRVDNDDSGIHQSYANACDLLAKEGRKVFDAIQQLVIYEIWPLWLLNKEVHEDRSLVKRGFEVLAEWER